MELARKLASEAIGTMLLLAVVIGSGIMAEHLSGGNVAVALLANTLATVGGLYVLIEVFGPVSGAHFNPAVSAAMAWRGELAKSAFAAYVVAQLVGAMWGAWLAHLMFDMQWLQFSGKVRAGLGQWVAESVATAGLLLVILRAPAGHAAPWWRRTSARPTGSPRPHPSPTPPLCSGACSATALRGLHPTVHWCLSSRNSLAWEWVLLCTTCSARAKHPTWRSSPTTGEKVSRWDHDGAKERNYSTVTG